MHPNPRSAFHCRRRAGALAVTGILLLALTGRVRGDSGESSLTAAQAKVTPRRRR